MKISSKAWKSYIDRLGRIDNKAAELASNYYSENPDASMEELIGYCVSVADYYGSAAGELACEMYDEVAEAAGIIIPPAEPARTATYGEVASAIQSTLLRSQNPEAVGAVVSNKVKTVGLDTLLNNSLRDGAEFAWVPSGDTCAFCIMLASNGWQRASKKALKNGHAEHVHNNCNCTYAIRFDEDTEVEGYDPEYYRDLYNNAEGDNWKDKVNYMRRDYYASNSKKIRKQKNESFTRRKTNDIINIHRAENPFLLKAPDAEVFLDSVQEHPDLLGQYTPITFKRALESLGMEVRPLGRGRHKGILFENGGGYIVNYGGSGAIEYHPAKDSRHGGRYYRLSDADHGKRWFNSRGKEINTKLTGSGGSQILK